MHRRSTMYELGASYQGESKNMEKDTLYIASHWFNSMFDNEKKEAYTAIEDML